MQYLPLVHSSTLESKPCGITEVFRLACFVHTSPSFETQWLDKTNNTLNICFYLLILHFQTQFICVIDIKSVRLFGVLIGTS